MAVDGARKHQIKARDTVTATFTLTPVLLTHLPISVLPADIRATPLGCLAMTSMFRPSRRLFTSLSLAKRKDDWKKVVLVRDKVAARSVGCPTFSPTTSPRSSVRCTCT
jgi:hypothetical protein